MKLTCLSSFLDLCFVKHREVVAVTVYQVKDRRSGNWWALAATTAGSPVATSTPEPPRRPTRAP